MSKEKTSKNCDTKRDRNFCLTTYIAVDKLETFLRSRDWISHWCYTSHDKDLNEDGTTKEFHTHVLLYTYHQKTASAVKKNFDRYSKEITAEGEQPQNTLVQICNDMVAQYRYQLHLDDADKYQYSFNERICDNPNWWHKLECSDGLNDNMTVAILNDMMNGVSVMDLASRYGKDFVYHVAHYQKVIAMYNREQMLKDTNSQNISEYFGILLNDSPFKREDIQIFFNCLEYIKSECLFSYNSQLNFYLDDKK